MDLALKILALMDEFPSEPFSFERKQIELKLEEMIAQHTQQIDDELQMSFDEGFSEGKWQSDQDHEQEIRELEEEVDDLGRELEGLKTEVDKAFVEGYEAATNERIV
jgi:hypothetical protein